MTGPLVLKLGGELIETAEGRARIAALAGAISVDRPLVVVHGGGRAIDAELDRRGIAPAKVDGLRVTDAATLDVVVAVLAGTANTALVSACIDAAVPAVGLTGADAGLARAPRSSAHRTSAGQVVDLGLVGDPDDVDPTLLQLLLVHGYVPIVASIGVEDCSALLLNVNADVMACRIAAALGASDLVIAGGTAGVLDSAGDTIPMLDAAGIESIIAGGTATAGMIAKLTACRTALDEGVAAVRIIDGRALDGSSGVDAAPGTTIVMTASAGDSGRIAAGL